MLAFGINSTVSAHTSAHPQRALTSVTLVLKWVPQAQFAGYFIALDKGYYKAEGLDVTIKPGGPDVVPETVVSGGGAQFGLDWFSALLAARDRGIPLVNIAQIFQASGMRMISFKSTGIDSIAKFRGKKVGVWFAGNEYQFFALMNKYHMAPPSKYMTVEQEPFVMTPFLTHKMDVAHAMTYNELGVVLEAGVKLSQLNVFDYNKLGVSILEDGIFADQSWVKSHSAIAVKFLRASIKGWKYALAHQTEAGQISFNHAPSGTTTLHHQIYMAQQVAKLIMFGAGLSHPIGYMDPMTYQRTWQTLLQQKVLKKAPSGAYDQSYWHKATM
jgi:NitT/TauT family transport system substrate-binding protein